MSDNTEQVEQITKEPNRDESHIAPKREKDPKRVAAGKKLAEKNKQMREEHARYKALESQREVEASPDTSKVETNDSPLSDGFLSQLTLGNVLSLLGVGLSIYALFFKGETKANETTFESLEEKQQPKTRPRQKTVETKSRPKFGM